MSRISKKQGGAVVNTQVSIQSNETLKLLKDEYGVNNIPDALDAILKECKPAAFELAGEKIAANAEIKSRLKGDKKQ